jgi:hypothetical protein
MNPLASRKRLLIAESDLNRAQLLNEWQSMADGVRSVTDRAKSIGSMASYAAALVAGLAAFRRGKPAEAGAKPSWLRTLLKVSGLVSTFWLAFRSPGRDKDAEE